MVATIENVKFQKKYFSVLWIMCYWKFVKVSSIKGWRRTLGAFSIIHLGKFPPPAILQTFLPPFVHFVFLLFFSLICIHYEMYLLKMSNIFPLATILQTFLLTADLRIFGFVWEDSLNLYYFLKVFVHFFKLVPAVCPLSHYCSFVFVLLFIVWFPWIQTYFNNLPFFKLFGLCPGGV